MHHEGPDSGALCGICSGKVKKGACDRYGAGRKMYGHAETEKFPDGQIPSGRRKRVYRPWVTPSRMLDTNRALTVLAEELPVPVKRPTREGDVFCQLDGRIVELEDFVTADGRMNTLPNIKKAIGCLGRLHSLLEDMDYGPRGGGYGIYELHFRGRMSGTHGKGLRAHKAL